MDDLRVTIASNLAAFRKARHWTQAELAERINYSDKVISKWERGESTPDVVVLKQLANLYGVSVDRLLQTGEAGEIPPAPEKRSAEDTAGEREMSHNQRLITLLSCLGVWFLALLSFVIVWALTRPRRILWQAFACALPASLIVLLVMNCLWGRRRNNRHIISALVWSALLCAFLMLPGRLWMILLLGIPGQIAVLCAFGLRRPEGGATGRTGV